MPGRALTSYKDLVSWQRGMELTIACYRFANTLPAEERFGLSSQLRRAAVSVPSNIAEGYGRRTRGEYLHSLSIARGSLIEVETQLLLAAALGYAKAEDRDSAMNLVRSATGLITALMCSLDQRIRKRVAGSG